MANAEILNIASVILSGGFQIFKMPSIVQRLENNASLVYNTYFQLQVWVVVITVGRTEYCIYIIRTGIRTVEVLTGKL